MKLLANQMANKKIIELTKKHNTHVVISLDVYYKNKVLKRTINNKTYIIYNGKESNRSL